MVLVIQNADNSHVSHLSPSLPKEERLVEAKQTWQRLSETERDKVFTLPLKELFESAASLTSGTRRQSMMLNHCLPASCCAVAIGKQRM